MVLAGCLATTGTTTRIDTPKAAVQLPAAPSFMGACPDSGVKAGMPPNQAYDLERAANKACSRNGAASRGWYNRLRARYAAAALKARKATPKASAAK